MVGRGSLDNASAFRYLMSYVYPVRKVAYLCNLAAAVAEMLLLGLKMDTRGLWSVSGVTFTPPQVLVEVFYPPNQC